MSMPTELADRVALIKLAQSGQSDIQIAEAAGCYSYAFLAGSGKEV